MIEVDATGISSKEGKGKWMEVKLGVMYSGKKKVGKGRRNRYKLKEKAIYSSLEEAENFGNGLFLETERKVGISNAKNSSFLMETNGVRT